MRCLKIGKSGSMKERHRGRAVGGWGPGAAAAGRAPAGRRQGGASATALDSRQKKKTEENY